MKNFLVKTKGNSYLSSNNKGNSKKYLVWIFVACVVLFFAGELVRGITAPVTSVLYSVRHYALTSSAAVPVFVRSRIELLNQIHELEQKIASQKGLEATLSYVTEENKELRNLLSASSSPRVVAGVIARPPYTPYDTIVIDKGSDDGIMLHAPVYYSEFNVLGYVRTVFEHTAYVTLLSSPGVESSVYMFGPNIFTTAHGEGGGTIRISVPQGVLLEKGVPIVLPSLDGGVLGVVSEIQSLSTEPEQHAYVTFDVPIQSIRLVSVAKTSIESSLNTSIQENIDHAKENILKIDIPNEIKQSLTDQTQHDTMMASTTHATTTP